MIDVAQINLLQWIEQDVKLKKVSLTNGGEWGGACPACGGQDRFRVWNQPYDHHPRFWCRKCDFKGDVITYVAWRNNLWRDGKPDFLAVCDVLNIPLDEQPRAQRPAPPERPYGDVNGGKDDYASLTSAWQSAAAAFFDWAQGELCDSTRAQSARLWLKARGLTKTGIFPLGFNPTERKETWGSVEVWLPVGIVIPWFASGIFWNMRIRRRDADVQAGHEKYISVRGAGNGLYNADSIFPGYTVVLTEGEFDAQVARTAIPPGERITVASIGSCTGARVLKWVSLLGISRRVLIAFDADESGDKAAGWWLEKLGPKARRLRPTQKDITDMWKANADLRGWLMSGVEAA